MSRVLLDTSAYSALARGEQEVAQACRYADKIFLTPVILGELMSGFLRGTHYQRNMDELQRLISSSRVHIPPITRETAECYATIHNSLRRAGTPIPANDIWIAASAMEHGLAVISLDMHFSKIAQIRVIQLSAH